jgi:cytidylate kinase
LKYKDLKIAIDGPASSGKSTIAKLLADEFQLVYVDTGAMYRTLTYLALKNNVEVNDEQRLADLLKETEITFKRDKNGQEVFANEENVTEAIRQNDVTNNVSVVSSFPKVREELVRRQQVISEQSGVVMDGRDIGTVVLPNADVKIFLVASVEERAERRYLENKEKGIESDFERLKQEIIDRDEYDTNRKVSPLKQAQDAVRLDTTSLSIPEVVKKSIEIVNNKIK